MRNDNLSKKYRYVAVYEDLLEKIYNNVFTINSLLPSEREIGTMYSVERTTVRKALDLLVSDGIIVKQPGIGAKIISKNKTSSNNDDSSDSDTILFFLAKTKNNADRLTQPFYSSLFYYIENELKKKGYKTIYSTISPEDNIEELLKKYSFAGIIFASFGVEKNHIDYVASTDIPFVVVNNEYDNGVLVIPNNFSGGYEATKHLIDLGHKKIGVLKGLPQDKSCYYRFLGFRAALDEYDIKFNEDFIRTTTWEAESGFLQMKDILSNNSELPTAIFAFNDATALGAIRAINEKGLKVPDDISVIGFDNISQSEYIFPQLSTIDTNVKAISETTVTTLHQIITNQELHNMRMVIPVTLVPRASTAKPKNK
ncbi:substrate-binding domain-containing protein [Clostridium sp. DL1XJH146]